MKKFITLLLAVAMFLVPCMASAATLTDVQNAGQLVVGTSPDFPPFENLAADGSVYGIEPDILAIIAERLGVTLVIQQNDFDSVLNGVVVNAYDMGASGISVTDERKENALFTDAYCLAAQAIVVKAGSPITCKADLEGKTVSVQTGTTAELFCMDGGYIVSSFAANSDAELALVTDKVDAWVIDDLTAAEMVAAYNAMNGEALVILDDAMTTEPYAFMFALGSDDLVEAINAIVNDLVADGTIADIFAANEAPYTSPVTEAAE